MRSWKLEGDQFYEVNYKRKEEMLTGGQSLKKNMTYSLQTTVIKGAPISYFLDNISWIFILWEYKPYTAPTIYILTFPSTLQQ